MSKTSQVKVGDRVRKEDSGIEGLVTKIKVRRSNSLRSDVDVLLNSEKVLTLGAATRKGGRASLQGWSVVAKTAPAPEPEPAPFVDEPTVEDVKDLEKLPEAPMPGERALPGFSPHLERVTRAWSKTVVSTVKKGVLTKGEMLDLLFGLTGQVGLECEFTPGELGDHMAKVAGELVKLQANAAETPA